jgi:cell division protein WhiA
VNEERFTLEVRLELSGLPLPTAREARAELAGMLLMGRRDLELAGWLTRDAAAGRPGDLPLSGLCADDQLALLVSSSAVARRAIALMQRALGLRPSLTAVSMTGRIGAAPAYRVALPAEAVRMRERSGTTAEAVDPDAEVDAETVALLRGAFIAGGSLSSPGRPVHLELAPVGVATAPLLIAAIRQVVAAAAPGHDAARSRVVLKSGAAVSDLLAALGATRAFLTFDDRRLRRQLRGEANRLANADAANLARVAGSAGAQVDAIERTVREHGWDGFDEVHRTVALARLANPSASVSELAELLGMARSTLHRRLRELECPEQDPKEPL